MFRQWCFCLVLALNSELGRIGSIPSAVRPKTWKYLLGISNCDKSQESSTNRAVFRQFKTMRKHTEKYVDLVLSSDEKRCIHDAIVQFLKEQEYLHFPSKFRESKQLFDDIYDYKNDNENDSYLSLGKNSYKSQSYSLLLEPTPEYIFENLDGMYDMNMNRIEMGMSNSTTTNNNNNKNNNNYTIRDRHKNSKTKNKNKSKNKNKNRNTNKWDSNESNDDSNDDIVSNRGKFLSSNRDISVLRGRHHFSDSKIEYQRGKTPEVVPKLTLENDLERMEQLLHIYLVFRCEYSFDELQEMAQKQEQEKKAKEKEIQQQLQVLNQNRNNTNNNNNNNNSGVNMTVPNATNMGFLSDVSVRTINSDTSATSQTSNNNTVASLGLGLSMSNHSSIVDNSSDSEQWSQANINIIAPNGNNNGVTKMNENNQNVQHINDHESLIKPFIHDYSGLISILSVFYRAYKDDKDDVNIYSTFHTFIHFVELELCEDNGLCFLLSSFLMVGRHKLEELFQHFDNESLHPNQWALEWMKNLFADIIGKYNFIQLIKLWDIYLCNEYSIFNSSNENGIPNSISNINKNIKNIKNTKNTKNSGSSNISSSSKINSEKKDNASKDIITNNENKNSYGRSGKSKTHKNKSVKSKIKSKNINKALSLLEERDKKRIKKNKNESIKSDKSGIIGNKKNDVNNNDSGNIGGLYIFHLYVCIATLMMLQEELLEKDHSELMHYLHHLPTLDIKQLVIHANNLRQEVLDEGLLNFLDIYDYSQNDFTDDSD